VFVGGSLVPAGGHNLMEPAAYGKPIIVGPHTENFAEIVEAFLANGAAIRVPGPRELEHTVVSLMGDPVRRARLGAAARALVEANRGARDRTMAVVSGLLPPDERGRGSVVPFRVVH
jgi:3-deoxy-D-manno-octulosonic-acid transferase